jgi:hypothetical protein
MLFRKIILVYSDNHIKPQNTLSEENKVFINIKTNVICSNHYDVKV